MGPAKIIKNVSDLHLFLGVDQPKHPLISMLRLDEVAESFTVNKFEYALGLFQLSLKDNCPFAISKYGRKPYDFQEASMIFSSPGQVLSYEKSQSKGDDNGWTLVFHSDLIKGSNLIDKMDQYSFFDYSVSEALHLSEGEKKLVSSIASKIEQEYSRQTDKHSQTIIISNLELLLNYCLRFYDRQFLGRANYNRGIVLRLKQLLKDYYDNHEEEKYGLPTVEYCGNSLNMSAKYLSDLLRKETGKSAQYYIHQFVISKAELMLLNSNKSVGQIAVELGFEYPQYFSTLFRKKKGVSPSEFRDI